MNNENQTMIIVAAHMEGGPSALMLEKLRVLGLSVLLASEFSLETKPDASEVELKMFYKPEEFRIYEAPTSKFIPSKNAQPWKRRRN